MLLRASHNHTGWTELIMFSQVTSFFWILYLDSVIFVYGPVAYIYDELMSSWTAWLGCLFAASTIFIEKSAYDAVMLILGLPT